MPKKVNAFVEKIILKNALKNIERFGEQLKDDEIRLEINPLNLGYTIPLNKPLCLIIKGAEIALKSKLKSLEGR